MTRTSILLLSILSPLLASAFIVPLNQQSPSLAVRSSTAAFMTKNAATGANLVITGNNIDLTDALQEYAQKRIGGLLEKLGSGGVVNYCEVHLSVSKNPAVSLHL
jgi:hypothetical protein